MRFPLPLLVGIALSLASCATNPTPSAAVHAKQPQSIFLVGRFSAPYQKEQTSTLLQRMGFDVRTEMTRDVALVLVGNNPVNQAGDGFDDVKATDDYCSAIEYGSTLIRLQDVVDLAAGPNAAFAGLGVQPAR